MANYLGPKKCTNDLRWYYCYSRRVLHSHLGPTLACTCLQGNGNLTTRWRLIYLDSSRKSLQMADTAADRFGNDDPDEFIADQDSKKTKASTRYSVAILREYLRAKEKNTAFENDTVDNLVSTLKEFFTNFRTKDGEYYSKSSMLTIRMGIKRHLLTPPHNRGFDVVKDPRFREANQAFTGMLKKVRSIGKGTVKHKQAIPPGKIRIK